MFCDELHMKKGNIQVVRSCVRVYHIQNLL